VSDDAVRALERRFQETGAAEDEAAWISARVRAGELPWARVAVAALCGHEAAKLASRDEMLRTVEETASTFGVTPGTVLRWTKSGCPKMRKGTDLAFNLAAVVQWREGRARNTSQRREVFLRVLAGVDNEAAALAHRLAATGGWNTFGTRELPTDEVIRRALGKWALAPKFVCQPAPPGKTRFSVERVELPTTIELRVVETATGRVVLRFDETVDWSHPLDPAYASLGIDDDGANVIVAFADADYNFPSPHFVVLPTTTAS